MLECLKQMLECLKQMLECSNARMLEWKA